VLRNIVPMTVFVVGWAVFLVWVVAATLDSIVKAHGRERTKREIAPYVAEGSISPADAERLLTAGEKVAPELLSPLTGGRRAP
jgi:hypothetical protein